MPKIGAYYPVHYGQEYLEYSLRSVLPAVDLAGIFYTAHPTHNRLMEDRVNPDSRQELVDAVARAGSPEKVHWVDCVARDKVEQHEEARHYMREWGCDSLLLVDCDEVWDTEALREGLAVAVEETEAYTISVNFIHFWRSFGWICRDAMMPERFVLPRNQRNRKPAFLRLSQPVFHFGYAQRPEMVKYKIAIHGHRAEWRSPTWFEEKFLAWSPYPPDGMRVGDVHPTCGGIWYPERFAKEQLPAFMRSHPYWDMEIIE